MGPLSASLAQDAATNTTGLPPLLLTPSSWFEIKVAGDPAVGLDFLEPGALLRANRHAVGAPGMEGASRWGVDRAGHIPAQDLPVALRMRVCHRCCGKQGLGVGVKRLRDPSSRRLHPASATERVRLSPRAKIFPFIHLRQGSAEKPLTVPLFAGPYGLRGPRRQRLSAGEYPYSQEPPRQPGGPTFVHQPSTEGDRSIGWPV